MIEKAYISGPLRTPVSGLSLLCIICLSKLFNPPDSWRRNQYFSPALGDAKTKRLSQTRVFRLYFLHTTLELGQRRLLQHVLWFQWVALYIFAKSCIYNPDTEETERELELSSLSRSQQLDLQREQDFVIIWMRVTAKLSMLQKMFKVSLWYIALIVQILKNKWNWPR